MTKARFNHPIYGKIQRITKRIARKLYDEGKDIIIAACNLNPESPYCIGSCIAKELDGEIIPFDKAVNFYEVHNCDRYSGYYASFYVKEDDE